MMMGTWARADHGPAARQNSATARQLSADLQINEASATARSTSRIAQARLAEACALRQMRGITASLAILRHQLPQVVAQVRHLFVACHRCRRRRYDADPHEPAPAGLARLFGPHVRARMLLGSAVATPRSIARIPEIMLNHVTGGGKTDLDEIYDRYGYLPEKRAALQRLEAHIKKLVAA